MGQQEHGAEIVAGLVRKWVGNAATRAVLRKLSEEGGLDRILRKYSGEDVALSVPERAAYVVVEGAVGRGAESFGIEPGLMKKYMGAPVIRRALVNILEGIAYFGVQQPQTTAAPFLVVWDFTKQCNLKCKHCYEEAEPVPDPDELSTEEAKAAVDRFAEAGVAAIAFSGGEPLLRKDLLDVIRYARSRDFFVSIASNGMLISQERAAELKEAGVEYVEISLDGFEETHDSFRGVQGAFKMTCEGIRNCVAAGIDTCVATTATHLNHKELPGFIDFVARELNPDRMMVFNYVPARRGKGIIKEDLTPEEREGVLKMLYGKLLDKECKMDVFCTAPQYARVAAEFSEKVAVPTHFMNKESMSLLKGRTAALTEFIGGCGAGRLYCGLEPNGDIQPCVFIPIKIGNIRKDNIKEIWRQSDVLKGIRDRKGFTGNCSSCEHRSVCGGCRARAYGYFGSLKASDPGCIRNKRLWESLKS